jgi:hypothetical protein
LIDRKAFPIDTNQDICKDEIGYALLVKTLGKIMDV